MDAEPSGLPASISTSSPQETEPTTITAVKKLPTPPQEGTPFEAAVGEKKKQPISKPDLKSDETASDGMNLDISNEDTGIPVVTQSKADLVRILKEWIETHPTKRIPELGKYDRNSLESNFAIEASLIETGQRIWIIRLGVIDLYLGWVLERPDGSYILVKAQYRRGGYVYYPWLGSELGYSDEAIANHKDVPRQVLTLRQYAKKRKLDPEDVLNDYDISKAALDFMEGTQESDSELSSLSSDSEPLITRRMKLRNKPSSKRHHSSESNDLSPKKKTKLKLFTRAKNTVPEDPNILSTTSPTASSPTLMDDIQNLNTRTNINRLTKIFPSMTSAICEAILLKNKGVFTNAVDDLSRLRDMPTSTDDASENGITTPTTRRCDKRKGQDLLQTPPPTTHHQHSNTHNHLGSPFSTTNQRSITPSSPSPTTTTTLNFYLSNPLLGAIPIPFHTLTSKTKFFKVACEAYFLSSSSSSRENAGEIVAASVWVKGMERAVVVVRKGKAGDVGWGEVVRGVGEMERRGMGMGKGKGVEGEVRCIVGG
ncbi:MAG: hypothetical protein Q9186_005370 [Xanthomendoza sp. 1 TL-2023]